jgi:hypothetical protein
MPARQPCLSPFRLERDLLCGPSMLSTRLAELWRNYSVTSPKPASFLHSSWSL